MIFKYTPAGHKRISVSEWFALEKWPHNCPDDRYHLYFIVIRNGIEYRCGPRIKVESAQVSALIFDASNGNDKENGNG